MHSIQRPQPDTLRLASALITRWLLLLLACALVFQPTVHAALTALKRANLPQNQAPKPFMHNPYYGSLDFFTRVNSYFDHDKPWYANDKVFVRYDGKRWSGKDTSVINCDTGKSCYDGHNGYDLRMHFEPVLSAASGVVLNAGWYNPLNHDDSFGLWASINHENGFVNVYGHLSALTVSTGERVGTQWQIGTTGTTGSSTGPHLHFGTYYYPSWQPTDPFGWTAHSPDPNTVADYNLWSTSTNVTPVPLLATQGQKLAPGAVLVDDSSAAWSSTGQWSSANAKEDIGNSLHWTSTTSGSATATATWQTLLPADGYYEVGAFVDDNHASSGWASYMITSNDPTHPANSVTHKVEVDQEHVGVFQNTFGSVNTAAQWIGLGTYYFKSGQTASVTLDNATGEDNQQVAADGIEFAPLTPQVYGFTASADNTPAQMLAGSNTTVNLTLANTSSFVWPAQAFNAVQITYRWLDSQGHTVMTSSPISLTHDLAVNENETYSIIVQAPVQPGTYTLQWDLMQGSQVFSLEGAQPRNDSVTVTNATSTPMPATPTPGPGTSVTATPTAKAVSSG
ncbi:MAG TPA: peptidoglycan DD-metalloendopeptidase family protein [Ktedonobacteraceae bacterium]